MAERDDTSGIRPHRATASGKHYAQRTPLTTDSPANECRAGAERSGGPQGQRGDNGRQSQEKYQGEILCQ